MVYPIQFYFLAVGVNGEGCIFDPLQEFRWQHFPSRFHEATEVRLAVHESDEIILLLVNTELTSCANDVSNTNPGASAADRPDQIGNPSLQRPSVTEFFNTNAFYPQVPGTLGTERGNRLYGPRNRHLDGSLFNNVQLDTRVSLQIRAEVFNLTNTANFASPNSVLGGANFGQLTQLTAGYTPREIQLAARLSF
jgi:hypothetical protein